MFSCGFGEIFKNTLFKEPLRATASDYTFIEKKKSTFREKTLGINASEILVFMKKSRYGSFLVSYKEENAI